MDLINKTLEKFSNKHSNKGEKPNILLYSNLWLIPIVLTFVIFNILKTKVLDGHVIAIMELFYTGVMLFIGFYFATKYNCCHKPNLIGASIQNSLLVLLVTIVAVSINPCKQYMQPSHVVMFNTLVLVISYNVVLYMINSNKKTYCNQKTCPKHTAIIIALHLLRLYFLR